MTDNTELRIDDMYFEHDHPEVKGKSMQEIHEYSLGHYQEERKKKNDQWYEDNLNSANSMMFGGLAATICSL